MSQKSSILVPTVALCLPLLEIEMRKSNKHRISGLVIFPIPRNNIFETSDFADPHFFCETMMRYSLLQCFYRRNYSETWNIWFPFFSPQRVFLPPPGEEFFFWLEKNQRAHTPADKRNFLGVRINFYKCCIYQIKQLFFLISSNRLLWT